jgi:Xaa-Pro aminopeptidase
VEAGSLLVDLRRCKDDGEIATIKKAAGIADKMMQLAWDTARVGVSELELSRAIRRGSEALGAEGESFPNIVASGPNASRPHHHPMKRRLRKGDMITIDLGAVVDGYCSDLTRNPVLGKSSLRYDAMYEVCLAAQQAGIKACTAGATGKDVDAVARDIIASAGYGDYFNHGLGHGVGLDIHEAPRLSPASTDTLRAGDVVTVEPGIYIPGFGGLRIEDLLVVTEGKPRVLSRITKNLVILPA